jgi:manganese oxidase
MPRNFLFLLYFFFISTIFAPYGSIPQPRQAPTPPRPVSDPSLGISIPETESVPLEDLALTGKESLSILDESALSEPLTSAKQYSLSSISLPTDYPQRWDNPKIKLSKQFKLMGKQMGTVQTPGIQPLGYEKDGNTKVFRLTAQPVEITLLDTAKAELNEMAIQDKKYPAMRHIDYKTLKCWGYNGSCPGPTIEINEGDHVRIIVKNELPEPTSIHWHGLELPNDQDGAAPETQRPIFPGETFTYEFTVHQSGTYMYYSGFNEMKQNGWGLQGIIVIHPKEPEHTLDKDVAIMLQEWSIMPGSNYPNLVTTNFNWFTFNGHVAPNIPIIKVQQHERVRIRFANMGMDNQPIHLHGYTWEEVGTDGGPIPPSARRKSSTIDVPPGCTRDVEFVAWNPGIWRLYCTKLKHTANAHGEVPFGVMNHGGMFTLIHVMPQSPEKTDHTNKKENV